LLSGCAQKAPRKAIVEEATVRYDELVARISSIPDTPFFADIEAFGEDAESKYNLIVRYRFSGEADAVKDFYLQEMERSGWMLDMSVNVVDASVFVFEKPKLIGVIEIRPKEHWYTVTLGRKISS
jgi:hypothetical protein